MSARASVYRASGPTVPDANEEPGLTDHPVVVEVELNDVPVSALEGERSCREHEHGRAGREQAE